ncbi:hypothetical protein QUF50_01625 [Thiotrichales bacterium HSG1]|nr:hypothetical protein [Thiotrichales bacterium HSG1]
MCHGIPIGGDNHTYGYAIGSSRMGLSTALSAGNNDQPFVNNTAHPNVAGTYIFRDGQSYCWAATYDGAGYTGVAEATYGNFPAYADTCTNITAPPVAASSHTRTSILLLFFSLGIVALIIRRRKLKVQ